MTKDSTLSRATITELVHRIDSNWTVLDATPASDGAHLVHHLTVETDAGDPRSVVLKATPPELDPVCGGEARVLAILDAHTTLPVPHVLGVVDATDADLSGGDGTHGDEGDAGGLPTPYFVATAVEGANHSRTDLESLSTNALEALARSTGRHLAALHGLDAVDAYGFVGISTDDSLDGGQPSADLDQLRVENPVRGWRAYLAVELDRVIPGLTDSRFADLAPTIRSALETRIDDLDGPFDPVLARIDHSLDNVVLDPETGAVVGLLDWEFCVAASPAYDLAFVEHTLAGGHRAFLPGVPDRRHTIRAPMLEGYADAGSSRVAERFRRNRPCYSLFATLHAMANFESWFAQLESADVSADRRDRAAEQLRAHARGLIDEGA